MKRGACVAVKYVLLFVDTEQFANDLQAMGPAERERAYDRVHEWYANHAGTIRGGSKLQSPETATTVRLEAASRSSPTGRSWRARRW